MERWRLLDLGTPEPYVSQTFYEAVAEAVHRGLSGNTLIMLQPGAPYVCLGYHQSLEKEIDVDFCRERELPIIRRSQGGGATYLDGDQVFYQIVAKDSPAVPRDVEKMFEGLLAVTVETYRRLGVRAEFKPLNDVVVGGRKISGNGAGVHESASILVGNVILDLDYEMMSRVLRVPDEKFRDKMAKSMREWVTSLGAELGRAPPAEEAKQVYASTFQELLRIRLVGDEPTEAEWQIFRDDVEPRHRSREWLYMEAPQASLREGRAVKIAGDVRIVEADHKARKLIRVRAEVRGDTILSVRIFGDFFAVPEKAITRLEQMLIGARLVKPEIMGITSRFYAETGVQTPGISPKDFSDSVLKIRELI